MCLKTHDNEVDADVRVRFAWHEATACAATSRGVSMRAGLMPRMREDRPVQFGGCRKHRVIWAQTESVRHRNQGLRPSEPSNWCYVQIRSPILGIQRISKSYGLAPKSSLQSLGGLAHLPSSASVPMPKLPQAASSPEKKDAGHGQSCVRKFRQVSAGAATAAAAGTATGTAAGIAWAAAPTATTAQGSTQVSTWAKIPSAAEEL